MIQPYFRHKKAHAKQITRTDHGKLIAPPHCAKTGRHRVIQTLHMRMQNLASMRAKLCINVCKILHRHMQNDYDGKPRTIRKRWTDRSQALAAADK